MTDFFLRNIPEVFFFYGLSFFSMGLAIYLEIGRSSEFDFARALRPLAAFGLLHGSHEWFEMFLLYNPQVNDGIFYYWIGIVRIVLLATSFLMLVAFGVRLIAGPGKAALIRRLLCAVILVWLFGLVLVTIFSPAERDRIIAIDVYTRYALAIPGAALTAWGLLLQRRNFIQAGMRGFGRDVALAALAFGLYGAIGQLFVSPSIIFPSGIFNAETFMRWFGFPIQVFRAAMACLAAIFIIRSLRAFEEENRRQIEALREAQLIERRRLEETRAELLHRTVRAQESERQRIARELHDETGQTLTAIGLGLRGLSETLRANPQRAVQQAHQLELLAVNGLEELQRLISGLHPPQLDDLGLLAALRWYANQISQHYNLPVHITSQGAIGDLPDDVRVVFFRVAQEALNNVVRHANATHVSIQLIGAPDRLTLQIKDDGKGFDASAISKKFDQNRSHWGLLGMFERAALIGAECHIDSEPGKGTCVKLSWNREMVEVANETDTPVAG